MERDISIFSGYCLVVEIVQKIENSYKFRRAGFAPKLTEIITVRNFQNPRYLLALAVSGRAEYSSRRTKHQLCAA